MIFSCLASLKATSSIIFSAFPLLLGTYEVTNCTVNPELNKTWIEMKFDLAQSGFKTRMTINHEFMPNSCKIKTQQLFLDDIEGSHLTKYERVTIERNRYFYQRDLNLFMTMKCLDLQKIAKGNPVAGEI